MHTIPYSTTVCTPYDESSYPNDSSAPSTYLSPIYQPVVVIHAPNVEMMIKNYPIISDLSNYYFCTACC